VWKSALDGLVSLASPLSRQIVEQSKENAATDDPDRLDWPAEALDQINETLGGSV
jgi:hypothetical protein